MADDQTQTVDPSDPTQAIVQQLLRQTLTGQSMQPTPEPPHSGDNRTWGSLLGQALVGGAGPGSTDAQNEQAGLRALQQVGLGMMSGSDYSQQRHSLGSIIANAVGGAQESNYAQIAAQQEYAKTQQEMQLARIKEALPLLTLQQQLQSAAAARKLAGTGTGTPTTIGAAGTGGIGAVGGDLPNDKAAALQMIAQRESGGDPTALNYVAKADPTAYDRGATASGKYQIVNSTWREGMQLAGLDPSKYATARDAPGPVQDQVAGALWDKYGNKPWQKGPTDWVKDEQGRYQLATVRPPAAPGGPSAAPAPTTTVTPPAGSTAAQALPVPPIPPAQPPAVRASPLPAGRPTGPPIITDQPPAGSATVAGLPGTATVGQPLPPSPAVAGNVNAIIGGMTGAGANAATLAPGPSAAAPAAPAPAVLTAQQRPPPSAPQLPPQAEPTPAAEVTGPPPPTTPDLLNFKPVRGPLPPDIQARIDNPLPPDVKQQLDNAITTALPDKVQEAIDARTKATIEARATATAQAEAYHKEDAARQIELAKTVAAQQAAIAAEQAKNVAAERASILSSQQTRINAEAADLGKRNSEIDATYGNNAQAGTNVRASVAQVRPLLQNLPGATSLLTSETARPIAAAIFGNADQKFADKATNADLFVGAMNRAADAMSPRATAGTERPSNINQYKAMLPSLVTSPEGKELALNYVDDIGKNQQDNHEWLVTHAEDPAFLNKRLNTPNRALAEIAMRKDPTQQMPQLPPMPSTFDAKAYMASPQDQKSEAKYTQSVTPGRDFYMWRAGSDGRMHAVKNTWTQGQGGSYTVVPGSPP